MCLLLIQIKVSISFPTSFLTSIACAFNFPRCLKKKEDIVATHVPEVDESRGPVLLKIAQIRWKCLLNIFPVGHCYIINTSHLRYLAMHYLAINQEYSLIDYSFKSLRFRPRKRKKLQKTLVARERKREVSRHLYTFHDRIFFQFLVETHAHS